MPTVSSDGSAFQVQKDKKSMVRNYIGKALQRDAWGEAFPLPYTVNKPLVWAISTSSEQ